MAHFVAWGFPATPNFGDTFLGQKCVTSLLPPWMQPETEGSERPLKVCMYVCHLFLTCVQIPYAYDILYAYALLLQVFGLLYGHATI